MAISATTVKQLREATGIGLMKCKEALEATDGDLDKAIEHLRKQGLKTAEKKAGRDTSEGVIASYIHSNGKIGVLLELKCETDFVARNDDFKTFVKDVAMQIAATNPMYVKKEDVPAAAIAKETEIIKAQLAGKPAAAAEKIIEGKLNKFYEDACLMEQLFVKDQSFKIKDVLTSMIAKIGENIVIRRFTRFQAGEEA